MSRQFILDYCSDGLQENLVVSCGRGAVGVSEVGVELSIVTFGVDLLLDDVSFVFTMVTQ